MATSSGTEISIHEKFNSSDADVTIQSSDGVQFCLHRKYLEANTSAFPGPDAGLIRSDGQQDVVHLTEPAKVLEILFEFVYPRRHPTLEGISIEMLLPLAEAVEKYEVFSAVTACEVQMRLFIPTHPAEILSHAVKHDRPLVNEAALCLSRTHWPLDEVLEILTARAQMPWVRYSEAWRAIFEDVIRTEWACLESRREDPDEQYPPCAKCTALRVLWITELERMKTVLELKTTLDIGFPREYTKILDACRCCPWPQEPEFIANAIQTAITRIPPFNDFINDPVGTRALVRGY